MHIEWTEDADVHRFLMLAPASAETVELTLDGYVLGRPRRASGGPPVFSVVTRLLERSEGRVLVARAFDASGALVATGDAQLDTTAGAGVWIRRRSDRTFDIGLERASSAVRSITVEADAFVLNDAISGASSSTRGWIRYTFERTGVRALVVRTFDADGAPRGALRRTLTVR